MPEVLICFDVDGTLDCAGGPVKVGRLHQLERAGAFIVIVSASGNRPEGFKEYIAGSRVENLKTAKNAFPTAILHLYVSDNPRDEQVAKEAGFSLIKPENFF